MVVTALVAALVAASPAASRSYAVEPSRSAVRYHVVHKLHRVTGASSAIEGKAVLQPEGRVLAMVRVPVGSFDSGERNRDANMREALDARRFPFVVFKGVAQLDGGALAPEGAPAVLEARMEGEVELHGVKRRVTVPLALRLSHGGEAHVRTTFEVSLESFGIERPSLLFVKIGDACRIEVDLALRRVDP
jgi:polyisoprenoid-binding protein YceI